MPIQAGAEKTALCNCISGSDCGGAANGLLSLTSSYSNVSQYLISRHNKCFIVHANPFELLLQMHSL